MQVKQEPERLRSCGWSYSLRIFVHKQVKDPDEPESKKSKGSSPVAEKNTEEDETLELDEGPEEVSSLFHAVCGMV